MPGYQDVGGYCVVNANNHSEADCVSLEMARLVAAAPDMLAALIALVERGTDSPEHCAAEAAIARAMGGTP